MENEKDPSESKIKKIERNLTALEEKYYEKSTKSTKSTMIMMILSIEEQEM